MSLRLNPISIFSAVLFNVVISLAVPAALAAMPPRDADLQTCGGAADLEATPTLTFTRQYTARGFVADGFASQALTVGVPADALVEALEALRSRLDLSADLRDGDRFLVRWEQTFSAENPLIQIPADRVRLLSVELATAKKGIQAIALFRPFTGPAAGNERFFFSDGSLAGPPPIRLPLDEIKVTSGYGLRADPLDQPARSEPVIVQPAPATPEPPPPPPIRSAQDQKEIARAYAGFSGGEQLGNARQVGNGIGPSYGDSSRGQEIDRLMIQRRIRAREEEAQRRAQAETQVQAETERRNAEQRAAEARAKAPIPMPRKPTTLYMHEGLDLLANIGTPVHAAADGTVTLARSDRGYGNAVHIDHGQRLTTLYAHMSRFAPGIVPGAEVKRGDVIGFAGSTGRSTGAHLHFELLVAGRPVDPATGTQAIKLSALDLARFKRQLLVEQSLRTNEGKNDRAPQRPSDLVATRPPGTAH